MIEEIKKNKPKGATHWQCGRYFMKTNVSIWFEFIDNDWVFINKPVDIICMTTLDAM